MLDVSCIIVNYNTAQLTIEAIKSIQKFTSDNLDYEIVVADNASKYEDFEQLKTLIDQIADSRLKLVRSRINTGFGSGNMLAVSHAAPSKYYAFINSDVLFVQQNTLKDLQNFMTTNPHIGVCSPQMLGPDRSFRSTLDHYATPARQLLKRGFLEKWDSTRYPKRKIKYNKPIKADYMQGSFLFVDAVAFNQVGGFDQHLFLYYEESDLCMRLKKLLQKDAYLYPQQEYIHLQGASTTKNIVIKMEQKISLLYLIHKHHGFLAHRFMLCFYVVKYFFSSLVKPKNWRLFQLLLRGAPLSASLSQKQKVLDR
ncbi:glycosyltransferase [Nonlabens ponticola]|uniref:Glycosyltransferase family 2 protein n=1 Tax=Nonlabens ponticola TaxID=2496866 RepID=A0A3S9MX87_9FLAO|nr:glycosyltransferase family 2 protein [Nonlabens ponticola]AZQ43752.1 glycosyltransferase family 2 protein [Nonlabens ponticola]